MVYVKMLQSAITSVVSEIPNEKIILVFTDKKWYLSFRKFNDFIYYDIEVTDIDY